MNFNNLEWNVYFWSINENKLKELNIFEHGCFMDELKIILNDNKINTMDSFKEKLKQILRYYFQYKCEWEILIENFPPYRPYYCTLNKNTCSIEPFYSKEKVDYILDKESFGNTFLPKDGEYYLNKLDDNAKKIDIYSQIMLNFNIFADYIVKTTDIKY